MYENKEEDILKAKNGDQAKMQQLLNENTGLIWSIVRRFNGRGYEQEDLYQIGAMGLIKAIKRFDQTYQVKLSTYAVPYILGEIKRFLRDDGMIKVSRSVKELNIKIKLINTQMTSTIAKYKRTNDFTQFELDNKQINDELLRLLQLAKEVNIYISSKEMKNYHKITVKLIEIQAEYVKVTIEQFKTLGEHGNNDAKSTQLKYNRKIRALQKQQDKLLEEIIEKIYEK